MLVTVERVAECIRKYQVLTDMETNPDKKSFMMVTLAGMKKEYERILQENVPCPPEIEKDLDKYLSKIEQDYAKTASN